MCLPATRILLGQVLLPKLSKNKKELETIISASVWPTLQPHLQHAVP
jgi:hypothetical protein